MTYPMDKTLEIVKAALDWNILSYPKQKQFNTDAMTIACRDMIRYLIQADNDEKKKEVYMQLMAHMEGVKLGQ